jgi:hypothetical protein
MAPDPAKGGHGAVPGRFAATSGSGAFPDHRRPLASPSMVGVKDGRGSDVASLLNGL